MLQQTESSIPSNASNVLTIRTIAGHTEPLTSILTIHNDVFHLQFLFLFLFVHSLFFLIFQMHRQHSNYVIIITM